MSLKIGAGSFEDFEYYSEDLKFYSLGMMRHQKCQEVIKINSESRRWWVWGMVGPRSRESSQAVL